MKNFIFKKVEIWIILLLFLIFFLVLIGYGSVLRHEMKGGEKFPFLQKIALFIAEIPGKTVRIYKTQKFDIDLVIKEDRFFQKPKFKRLIDKKRNELLLLSRYSGDLSRGIVEIVDLNTFKILHSYKPDTKSLLSEVDTNKEDFKRLNIDSAPNRYLFFHSFVEKNGDLIFKYKSPLIKTNLCSKKIWVNQSGTFHHSIEKDSEKNYFIPIKIFPSVIDKRIVGKNYETFDDDGIAKISESGEIIYKKSVSQILIENGYKNLLFSRGNFYKDPIHLNDIQPVLKDGPYWKKGDLFLSLRNLSSILHYRPNSNKIINIISGPFSHQHDVNIISNKEISLFNNNAFMTFQKKEILSHSEILIYDFETKKFTKKFQNGMKENSVRTATLGVHHILNDGSMMVEEGKSGRILFFNQNGSLEWEYLNKAENKKTYILSWSRIIEDEDKIKRLREIIKENKCKN